MFDDRTRHYRTLASRLRQMAGRTQFADLRDGYLELASRFDRLAERTQRSRGMTSATHAAEIFALARHPRSSK